MTPSVVRYIVFSDLIKDYFNSSEIVNLTMADDYLHLSFFSTRQKEDDGLPLSLFVRPLFLECGDYDFHFEFIKPSTKRQHKNVTKSFVVRVANSVISEFNQEYLKKLKNG